jgi:hypothetical protein
VKGKKEEALRAPCSVLRASSCFVVLFVLRASCFVLRASWCFFLLKNIFALNFLTFAEKSDGVNYYIIMYRHVHCMYTLCHVYKSTVHHHGHV